MKIRTKLALVTLAVSLTAPTLGYSLTLSDLFHLIRSRVFGWQTPPPITVQTPQGPVQVPAIQRYQSWPVPSRVNPSDVHLSQP